MGFIPSGGSTRFQTWLEYIDSISYFITFFKVLHLYLEVLHCSLLVWHSVHQGSCHKTLQLQRGTTCVCVSEMNYSTDFDPCAPSSCLGCQTNALMVSTRYVLVSTWIITFLPLRRGNGMLMTRSYGASSCTIGIEEVCVSLSLLSSSRIILLLGLWFIT